MGLLRTFFIFIIVYWVIKYLVRTFTVISGSKKTESRSSTENKNNRTFVSKQKKMVEQLSEDVDYEEIK